MDLSKVLEQLRKELAHLDAAILSLERLQAKGGAARASTEMLTALVERPENHTAGVRAPAAAPRACQVT